MRDNERLLVCIEAFHNLHGTISSKALYRLTVFDIFALKTSNIMDGEGHFGKSENAIMILTGDGEL